MHLRTLALSVATFILGTISIGIVYAWSGPTAAPPGGNVAAPINVGSTDQVKDGGIGVNKLAAFGNSLLGGFAGSNAYLNFGEIPTPSDPSTGYGIRDNDGTLEFKNEGGSWDCIQTTVYNLVGGSSSWTTNGNDIYNTNSGRVGIGTQNPLQILDAYVGTQIDGLRVTTSDSGSLVLRRNAPHEFVLGSFDSASTLPFVTNSQSRFQVDGSGNFTIRSQLYTPSMGNAAGTYPVCWSSGGHVTYASACSASDIPLKKNIHDYTDGLQKVEALRPVNFEWKDKSRGEGNQIGLIAQEVEKVVPEVVSTDSNSIKSIDYAKLVPVLVKAIQEQQTEIESLKDRLAGL